MPVLDEPRPSTQIEHHWIVNIKDNQDHIRIRLPLYSYSTTITGWGGPSKASSKSQPQACCYVNLRHANSEPNILSLYPLHIGFLSLSPYVDLYYL